MAEAGFDLSIYYPNLWDEDYFEPASGQLEFFPEPMLHDQPELPPPPPGPIRAAQDLAEQEGWIPQCSITCLYASAGNDTRPFTYLRPEVVTEEVISGWILPAFFVFVDRDSPRSMEEMDLEFDDDRTRIETVESRPVEDGPWEMAALLRVRVTSDRHPVQDYAVLRIRARNEDFVEDALAEEWSPLWYIGIRDGCRMFGNPGRCTNILGSRAHSIPLRLGVMFWVTEHFRGYELTDEDWRPLHPFGHRVPVTGGRHLRQLATWRRWPSAGWGTDRWVSLFRLERG